MKIYTYDTTLRDGSQAPKVSFSLEDKLRIVQKLDEFGIDYIECGWPGANPKDTALFERLKRLKLSSKIVAFGATRRPNKSIEQDQQVLELLKSEAKYITIFGKSWDFHVFNALKTTLEENLNMIFETIEFLKKSVEEVIFDAEHFFDGYKANKEYALKVVKTAKEAGADWIVLCDTNGGALPNEVFQIVKEVKEELKDAKIGIHAHNDSECAVANSIMAVLAGASQVHGTINGIGERCGNANLCSVIANLQLKSGYKVVEEENLKKLTQLSYFVSEISNIPIPPNMPYVGEGAFSHKAGVHASAILKDTRTYEHIDPILVGNSRKVVISDLSGRSNLRHRLLQMGLEVEENSPELIRLLEKIKELEKEGYQFEIADASFELLCLRHFGLLKEFYKLEAYRVLIARRSEDLLPVSEATVRIRVENTLQHTVALGNGPVSALDGALRKGLEEFYPSLKEVELKDYRVRIVNEKDGTKAKVRVVIQSTDGQREWGTVGVSENIIEASWIALNDSLIYKLVKDEPI
ncbi:MAG: citramalate synthase [Aquificaceae bacterium]|nr:citramalate synthase [Aquificaceae bacterium]MDW8237605.1 citramalate synthase [Aquificaceae bacterium]